MNDVRVIGLIWGTSVVIQDIGESVPHGVTVTIPAAKAAKSKDLWRLLSQKQLFRLNPGPFQEYPPGFPVPPLPDNTELDRLREEKRQLEEQNRLLKQTIDQQGGKLDTILGFLENARLAPSPVVVAPQTVSGAPQAPVARDNGVVDAGVPTYIPSQIKPQGVESHVEVQKETAEGNSTARAGAALRKLRQKKE